MRFKLKIIYYYLLIKLRKRLRTRNDIDNYQKKKCEAFAKKILIKSPFYRPFIEAGNFSWKALPELTKTSFMENFDAINTCGINLEEAMPFALNAEINRNFSPEINGITVGLSTGTSGKRGLFLVSENERARWVALVMSRVIKPRLFKKQKIAFFLRANSNLYASVSSSLFEFRYFDIFRPLDELLKELNLYSPDILAAPPSLLIDIASAQEKEYILIHPSQIISFAEVLHPLQKDYITKQIKAPLTEVYQCTEGFLGVSCSEGSIHLNEDFIQINKEWIDDDKFYPIITDFTRESQPIVNYKLNDVLQIKKDPCACGSPFISLEQIIGRDDDVLIFNNRKIYPDLLVRRIALHCNNFQNYTIIQTNENNLDIYIECTKKEMSQTEKYFREAISGLLFEFGIQNTELKFKNERVRIPGNKHRKIIRKICA